MGDEQQQVGNATPSRRAGVSKSLFFISIALVALVGFIAGTRSNELFAAIAPALGIKIEKGVLDLASVQKTYQELLSNYDGEVDKNKLIDGASRGLVDATGDPYTVFMDKSEAEEFEKELSGEIGGGIGAEIGIRAGKPTIIRVLPDNPAEKAGVKAGDIIAAVNDRVSGDWTADKAAAEIRGEVGTTVKLTLLRGEQDVKDITVTRQAITSPSVQSDIKDNIGILTITRFDPETGQLARAAATKFKQANVKAVVLDLRGNGGGYIDAAQDVAGLWLNNKLVVSERVKDKVVEELHTKNDAVLEGVKTVVLVNGGSASASEIVAGALQEHGAATLVGEKTFGKGTVQKIIKLSDGRKLKVTIAKWFTPQGKNITKNGIEPEQKVELTAADSDAGKDPQLQAATAQLK